MRAAVGVGASDQQTEGVCVSSILKSSLTIIANIYTIDYNKHLPVVMVRLEKNSINMYTSYNEMKNTDGCIQTSCLNNGYYVASVVQSPHGSNLCLFQTIYSMPNHLHTREC